MFEYVADYQYGVLGGIAVTLLVFVALRLMVLRFLLLEFEPIAISNLYAAFSLCILFVICELGLADISEFYRFASITASFFLGLFLVSLFSKRRSAEEVGLRLATIVRNDGDVRPVFWFLFFIYVVAQGALSASLIAYGASGDDRIVIAKQYRVLDVFRLGSSYLTIFYSLFLFLIERRPRYLLALAVVFLLGIVSGSKGAVGGFVLSCAAAVALIHGRIGWKAILVVTLLALLSPLPVVLFNGQDPSALFVILLDRLFASGDAYYYGLVASDYVDYYGFYNPLLYLLHPFLKLVGTAGYEWPLGSMLFGDAHGGDVTGVGPNALLPLLLVVLFQGQMTIVLLLAMLFGCGVGVVRSVSINALFLNVRPSFWQLNVFLIGFSAIPVIYFDVGLFEQYIIGNSLICLLVMWFKRSLIPAMRIGRTQRLEALEALEAQSCKDLRISRVE